MKKRNKSPEGGSNWMDTYGDMVTLLLCFFVLLYSISAVDQQKWQIIVKSLNPDAEKVEELKLEQNENAKPAEEVVLEPAVDQFDELYDTLEQSVKEQGLQASVELVKGDGFTFISFRDKVFFDGESSVIRPEGKQILDAFMNVIGGANDAIQEIDVLGHTSQAAPGQPNEAYTDRMLAAMRSTEVVVYIQDKGTINAEKIVQTSFGQHRPIASYETTEGRAQNRRVELIITKSGAVQKSLDQYYNEIYGTSQ
ncbi:MAG: flagellar motor protein MotB [Lachnospiraceae bacterium]|nr:flagellar motor protein MotB [Lachnospiraceae bacterium]